MCWNFLVILPIQFASMTSKRPMPCSALIAWRTLRSFFPRYGNKLIVVVQVKPSYMYQK